ncbi:hypothetical protein LRS10_13885 [Phenylobacterium sp. J426]|uniref:hypothetical protein n=1 Tax=Phenylobacterium sp. J426 TaxID=2898439 RepID=UPI002150EFCC|nr:hypothetical protein [Phenylobacterium sp. J426]MCR5875184.1 hypothetical protein [Phenylobacterium sp. J426]
MILDMVAGALCGAVALGAFSIHVISSRHRRNWMTIPQYVRRGVLLCGVMFTWRSVNFFSIAESAEGLGHINAEGMMALVVITYTIWALAVWLFRATLPTPGWDRVEDTQHKLREEPGLAPVMMTLPDVVKVAQASGLPAVGPGEPPEAVIREGKRRSMRAKP